MTKQTSVFRMFPAAFWSANAMEIFERMGWYGFYAVSSVYLQGEVGEGCLGFSSEDRGVIQGLVTFFLYLFPAVFGALADRYGYKLMFILSGFVMIPGYLLLQFPTTFWGFFGVYMLVAVGHGMFKPVVIGTIAKTTTEKTGSVGFGIFYQMVNIGGFVGPLVAGVIRGWDWKFVFVASAGWIVVMQLVCLITYREPVTGEERKRKPLGKVFGEMVEVIGNGRFFVLIAGLLTALVMGTKMWSIGIAGWVALGWLVLNLVFDVVVRLSRRNGSKPKPRFWLLQSMRVGEGRYLLFLLLMSGFWISFNQIFMTLPVYIRDYVSTADLVQILNAVGIDTSVEWINKSLLEENTGEVKPVHLINLNALGIICLQFFISWLSRKMKALSSIMAGIAVTAISFLVYLTGQSGLIIVAAILIFSVGEMLSSPRSKDYAARIAPPGKVGMYMGYFYWCVALGNLLGGLLSGVLYAHFGPIEHGGVDDPDLMWVIFAVLAAFSVVSLRIYDRWVSKTAAAAADTADTAEA